MKYVLGLRSGDSMDVKFPEGFTVNYMMSSWDENGKYSRVEHSTVVTRMNAYYWDDDDHCCLDFYFYNDNVDKRHFAKLWDLTEESRKKVEEFVKANYKG